MLCIVGNQFNQMLRAGSYALAACLTCLFVYNCNAVNDMNRIKRACLYAASITHTAIITAFGSAARRKYSHLAVLASVIVIVIICFITGSDTFYKGNLPNACLCLNAHDFRNNLADWLSAYRTGVYRSLSLCNRRCKTGAACISAAAAVITWKRFQNCCLLFIDLYFKFDCCNAEEQAYE